MQNLELETVGRRPPPTLDEVRRLTAENRTTTDGALLRKLARMRYEAFAGLDRSPGLASWPPPAPPIETVAGQPPVIDRSALSGETVRAGIIGHGCLHVKGLFDQSQIDWFVGAIDAVFAALEASQQDSKTDPGPWYQPFHKVDDRKLGGPRRWVQGGGGVWTADAPPALFALIDTFEELGVVDAITGHLGERPALSVDKCTLRRVPLTSGTDWHQDGAFLGKGIRTVNVWVALTDCGRDAPGLDIVPKRFGQVLETGTEGAWFDWSVGPGVVERESVDAPVLRPMFEAGDALLFDDMFLHRTAIDPAMTKERYAIETWFFAPSTYPERQIPLAI